MCLLQPPQQIVHALTVHTSRPQVAEPLSHVGLISGLEVERLERRRTQIRHAELSTEALR